MLMLCRPERTGPQMFFNLGVVSRRICGCFSVAISQYNRAGSIIRAGGPLLIRP